MGREVRGKREEKGGEESTVCGGAGEGARQGRGGGRTEVRILAAAGSTLSRPIQVAYSRGRRGMKRVLFPVRTSTAP